MRKKITGLGIIIGAIVVIGLMLVSQYNGLVSKKSEVDAAYSKVDTALQRRFDLIPNIVNTAKGYMEHESEVFTKIADARAKIGASTTPEQAQEGQAELTSALSRLLVITENYPELKANEQMNTLITELEGAENRIFVARNDFNTVATAYNRSVKSFPTVLFANMFGYQEVSLFKADSEAQSAPKVDFNRKP